jgi:hypothetical protein
MAANAPHVGDDTSRIVLHREPIDELAFRRSWAFPNVAKAIGGELGGFETTGEEVPHHLVGEEQQCRSRCGE